MTKHNAALNAARDKEHATHVNHAIQQATGTTQGTLEQQTHYLDPAAAAQLRGIPVVGGRGTYGGAIKGTRPDTLEWVPKPPKQHRRKL